MGIIDTFAVVGIGILFLSSFSGGLGNRSRQNFTPVQLNPQTYEVSAATREGIGFVHKAPAIITEASETAKQAAATAGQAFKLAEEAKSIRLSVLGLLRNIQEG